MCNTHSHSECVYINFVYKSIFLFLFAVLIKVNSNLLANKFCVYRFGCFFIAGELFSSYYNSLIFAPRTAVYTSRFSRQHILLYLNKCQTNNGIIRKQTLCVLVTLLPQSHELCPRGLRILEF
jgi:hypothetical protein